jgi:hypothetical protein
MEKITKISNPEDEVGTYFGASIAMENNQIAVGHFNGEKSFIYSTEDLIHSHFSKRLNHHHLTRVNSAGI